MAMRRCALISSLVLGALVLSATARADRPLHFKSTFSDSFSAPAGQLCDFDYAQTFTEEDNIQLFGDPNNPTKFVDHATLFVTHTNVDTGYTLTEVDHVTVTSDSATGTTRQRGILWHLRDPSGKIVVVQAGQAIFDDLTGEVIKVTPNFNPDFAAVVCPALGGRPAT
jgi:hypothetical protein